MPLTVTSKDCPTPSPICISEHPQIWVTKKLPKGCPERSKRILFKTVMMCKKRPETSSTNNNRRSWDLAAKILWRIFKKEEIFLKASSQSWPVKSRLCIMIDQERTRKSINQIPNRRIIYWKLSPKEDTPILTSDYPKATPRTSKRRDQSLIKLLKNLQKKLIDKNWIKESKLVRVAATIIIWRQRIDKVMMHIRNNNIIIMSKTAREARLKIILQTTRMWSLRSVLWTPIIRKIERWIRINSRTIVGIT